MSKSEALLSLQQRSSIKPSRKWFIWVFSWQANNCSNQPVCQAFPHLLGWIMKTEVASVWICCCLSHSRAAHRDPDSQSLDLRRWTIRPWSICPPHTRKAVLFHSSLPLHIYPLYLQYFHPNRSMGTHPSSVSALMYFPLLMKSGKVFLKETSFFPFFGYCALHAFLYHCTRVNIGNHLEQHFINRIH